MPTSYRFRSDPRQFTDRQFGKMGNGMEKILPGLYVGNFRDAKDKIILKDHGVTHILSIHDNAKPIHKDKFKYLCIAASDISSQDLIQFFPKCTDFIHKARLKGGTVLVHCLAGVSRSVTVTVAYIMTITGLGWRDALNAVRGARRCANPNFGFQMQLQAFEHSGLNEERIRVARKFPKNELNDEPECKRLVFIHSQWVLHGSSVDDTTYPLLHNAYKSSASPMTTSDNEVTTVPHNGETSLENGNNNDTSKRKSQEACIHPSGNTLDSKDKVKMEPQLPTSFKTLPDAKQSVSTGLQTDKQGNCQTQIEAGSETADVEKHVLDFFEQNSCSKPSQKL